MQTGTHYTGSSRTPRLGSLLLLLCLSHSLTGVAQDRMPPLQESSLTAEQVAAIDELRRIRGIELRGPWIPLLRSPEVLRRARAMGDYLRYESTLPPRLSEFLILLTAREWTQQYEWQAHHAIALQAGLDAATVDAVAEARRPQQMTADEAMLYDLFTELHRNRGVSDTTYTNAVAAFGEQGIIDAVSIVGYYTLLAMVMNTAQTPLPAGTAPGLAPLP
jgi:4-carboxymuconolactone decarboxylase